MASSEPVKPRGYRVRRGDSLYVIAGKFNVSINDIISWNSLDPGKYLQPGQKLTLYVGGS
jgi:membrane-bound lytic murein transglycosylase D